MPAPTTAAPSTSPNVLASPVTSVVASSVPVKGRKSLRKVKSADALAIAAWLRVMDEDESTWVIVVPSGMSAPETGSPTYRLAVLANPVTVVVLFSVPISAGPSPKKVRLAEPLAVAAWLRVSDDEELIRAMVVPAAMPLPETGSPTNNPVVLARPVTEVEPFSVPMMTGLPATATELAPSTVLDGATGWRFEVMSMSRALLLGLVA